VRYGAVKVRFQDVRPRTELAFTPYDPVLAERV